MTRLNCDRDDIVTDDEIVDTLGGEEVNADDNEDDVDEEVGKVPSHGDTFQAMAWRVRQEECDPMQLLQVKRIRDLAARKRASATK